MVVCLLPSFRINWHMASRLQSATQCTAARSFRAPEQVAREWGSRAVRADAHSRGWPGQQSPRSLRRGHFDTLPANRAGVRLKVMPGHANNELPVRRRPNDVPEPRSVRYSRMRWGKGRPADARRLPYDVIDVGRPGAGGVHHWFGRYILQYAPVKQRLFRCVIPGGDLLDARRSGRSISLIGGPGA